RRRHTRFSRDWSSDVCSSDLNLLKQKLALPPGFTYKWSGEYEFELRAKERLQLILPIVFFVIFMLLYVVFHSVTEAAVLIFPTRSEERRVGKEFRVRWSQ